jgi:ABC-type Fe3+/spermidine/putrescine transport system ATPase subunit
VLDVHEYGIEIRDLVKVFQLSPVPGSSHSISSVAALDGVDLRINPGELFVILGPSGCGKSTLLRCVAGLEEPQQGVISLGGRTVFSGEFGR